MLSIMLTRQVMLWIVNLLRDYVFFLAILYFPGKVKVNCCCTFFCEAEYRATATTTAEIVWLHWWLSDLGVSSSAPTLRYCDNKSAIQIAHNSVFHEYTKHIEIDYHLVHHQLQLGTFSLPFFTSTMKLADFFTKSHAIMRFRFLLD